MKFDLLALSDATRDTFVYLTEAKVSCRLDTRECKLILSYGEKIPVNDIVKEVGGNAANVAVGLACFGFRSAILGSIGDDDDGKDIKSILQKRGVETAFLETVKGGRTNHSIILTVQGERTILTHHPKRRPYRGALPNSKWIYLTSGETEGLSKTVRDKVLKGASRLAYNPGIREIRRGYSAIKKNLSLTEALFVNKEEAEMIARVPRNIGEKHLARLLHKLLNLGPRMVVITDGIRGAYGVIRGGEAYHVPIFPAKRIEPTGAGDAFASGFMGAILSKEPLEKALLWGIVNSASVIEKIGGQVGLLTKNKMLSILKKNPRFKARRFSAYGRKAR